MCVCVAADFVSSFLLAKHVAMGNRESELTLIELVNSEKLCGYTYHFSILFSAQY